MIGQDCISFRLHAHMSPKAKKRQDSSICKVMFSRNSSPPIIILPLPPPYLTQCLSLFFFTLAALLLTCFFFSLLRLTRMTRREKEKEAESRARPSFFFVLSIFFLLYTRLRTLEKTRRWEPPSVAIYVLFKVIFRCEKKKQSCSRPPLKKKTRTFYRLRVPFSSLPSISLTSFSLCLFGILFSLESNKLRTTIRWATIFPWASTFLPPRL